MNQSPILTPTFGNRLEFIRQDHHLTIKAMASSVGVSPATWRNYEKDKTYPSENTLWNFCGIYHVNRDWLDSYEGVPYAAGYQPGDPLGEPGDYVETMVQAIESVFQDLFKMEDRVDKAIEMAEGSMSDFEALEEWDQKKSYKWTCGAYYENPEEAFFEKVDKEERRRQLTKKQDEVYVLYYKVGYNQYEIAEILGIDQTSVRDRINLNSRVYFVTTSPPMLVTE